MRKTIVTPETLVPLSCIGIVATCAFWMAGLANDVSTAKETIERMKADRTSIEAEIIQQMASQAATMSEIQAQAAATDAKVTILLQWAESGRRMRSNIQDGRF